MSDSKITGLGSLSATPATGDYYVIVDVSDTSMSGTGTNKKIAASRIQHTNGTANQIEGTFYLGRSGVGATLVMRNSVGSPTWNLYSGVTGTEEFSFYNTTAASHLVKLNTASYMVDIAGACHASSFPTSSDIRLKENIKELKEGRDILSKLSRIKAYEFDWTDNYKSEKQFHKKDKNKKDKQVGFIAQEIQAEFPELVTTWAHEGKDGTIIEDALAVDYGRMVPILLEAINQLNQEIKSLKGNKK